MFNFFNITFCWDYPSSKKRILKNLSNFISNPQRKSYYELMFFFGIQYKLYLNISEYSCQCIVVKLLYIWFSNKFHLFSESTKCRSIQYFIVFVLCNFTLKLVSKKFLLFSFF
ncbi:hypothetical protein H311_00170 [Anncaliia algerae PRA109]|nr:hypothetical protein H311_00170 [Anncaliia algerae PRA109]